MKWANKGHEFDEIAERFDEIEQIILYGAGEFGVQCANMLNGIGATFIFADRMKCIKGSFMGRKVIHPREILNNRKSIIILCMARDNAGIVLKHLELQGFRYGETIYDVHSFMNYFIYIIAAYKYNKCLMLDCSVMATYHCSLRCKNCMGGFPYIKSPNKVSFEDFKQDVDILFSNIDYVMEFGIAGGEMFLVKNLDDYISYVMENYKDKIYNCTMITNGTIIPNDRVLSSMEKYKMHVTVSKYDSIPGWEDKYIALKNVLDERNIPISQIKYDNWVDMGWKDKKYKDDVKEMFDACGMQCRVVRGGKLNYCVHAMTANEALYGMDLGMDELDLAEEHDEMKKVILEYHMGFNTTGEMTMCHYCNGYVNINSRKVSVAEQL